MNNKKKLIILIVVVGLLAIFLGVSMSYAYFTTAVLGNERAKESIITSGIVSVEYDNGDAISALDFYPGDSVEKTFSVKNTGNVSTTYSIYLNDIINTFNTKEDLVYELISQDGGINVDKTTCPSTSSQIASVVEIGVNETHHYILKITFKETGISQDDNHGVKFSAKVELEEEKPLPNLLSERLPVLKDKGAQDLMYDGKDSLGEYGTDDNNLRYVGVEAKNYIYYNCSTINADEMNDETCEKWRIIGLFNNIEDDNGVSASRVKIMRNERFNTQYSWDSSDQSLNNGNGVNQWGESTYKDGTLYEGADLMRELNTDYLGNITVGIDGEWFLGNNNDKWTMPSTILCSNAQNMIETVNWNTGYINDMYNKKVYEIYQYERNTDTTLACEKYSELECKDDVIRKTNWMGKVALIYSTDYMYSNDVMERCVDKTAYSLDRDCRTRTWMYDERNDKRNYMWTISLVSSGEIVRINSGGNFLNMGTSNTYGVFPTLYLKSNVKILSGDGTETSPYKLSI